MRKRLLQIVIIVIIILICGYLSFQSVKERDNKISLKEFMIGKKDEMNLKIIVGGIMFGLIFGFMDNYFLITGLDIFEKYLPQDNKLKAGWGNTFSDFLGSILGTFISIIFINIFEIDQNKVPIWTNSIGMVIGCILGMYIPYYIKKIIK